MLAAPRSVPMPDRRHVCPHPRQIYLASLSRIAEYYAEHDFDTSYDFFRCVRPTNGRCDGHPHPRTQRAGCHREVAS